MSNSILDAFGQKTYDESRPMSRVFIANVFSYMFAALAISGVFAYVFSHNESLVNSMVTFNNAGKGALSGIGWLVMLSPLVIIFALGFGLHRLPLWAVVTLFLVFSSLMGMSLFYVFLIYKIGSIISVFFITAGMFGAMAVLGYTTKTDLTKLGPILMMLIFGMIIATFVNMFVGSSPMQYVISCIGVVVFTLMTAYKMQQIKYMSQEVEYGNESTAKLAVMAGLSLYVTFINLFLSLLRLFGERN